MQEENTAQSVSTASAQPEEKLSKRNLFMFALGTLGRDFLYNFFNGYLLSFCVFTKTLNDAQFTAITAIIVAARIFDAFNDPVMGGIVENTRTKWGKYKPWQLIGCILTAGVIVALFSVPAQGWGFIGLLAAMYFLFSITYTMNDISYWGMMPTLTSDPHDRDKLMTVTQISVGIGGGLAGIVVPTLAMGPNPLGGSASNAFAIMSIFSAVLMCVFQLFTIFGVKEKPLPKNLLKTPPMKIKDMFKVLFKNDQLLWCALVLLLFSVGTNVVGGGLGMMYIYFDNAYNGTLWMVFGVGWAICSIVFTLFYPGLAKKYGRDKLFYSCGISIIVGYAIMMIFGLTVPKIELFTLSIPFLNLNLTITLRYLLMFLAYAAAGWGGGLYMIMVINITNTVEYNEFKTGKRDEGLIFALRPFTSKLASALSQGMVSLVYIIARVLPYTNRLTEIDRKLSSETPEQVVAAVQAENPSGIKILLICTCVIPMIFLAVALIVYKKKCVLNEARMVEITEEIKRRKALELEETVADEFFDTERIEELVANDELAEDEILTDEAIAAAPDNEDEIQSDISE